MSAAPAKTSRKSAANTPALSTEHKDALARGRAEGRIVRHYLDALENSKPRPGRRRTDESIRTRLGWIEEKLVDAGSLERLHLVQQRKDLEAELGKPEEAVDLTAAEKDFVKVAKSYGERKGISYPSWREVGVRPDVLKRAGIARTRG